MSTSQHDAYKKKIETRAAGIIKSLGITLTKPAKWVKWKDTGKECYLITFPWDSKLDDLRKAEKAMKTAFRAALVAATEYEANMNLNCHPLFITVTLKNDYSEEKSKKPLKCA